MLLRVILALTLVAAFAPGAAATDPPVCDDRTCLVSVESRVCVTDPCDGLVVCLAHARVCTDRL